MPTRTVIKIVTKTDFAEPISLTSQAGNLDPTVSTAHCWD